jgi:hypothetical protein
MKRDPHLPHPEVCDWLLSQEWSEPDTVKVSSDRQESETYDCCEASAAIGRDEIIDLLLPLLGLQILREDVVARQADAYEANGLTPEQRLMVDLSELLRLADVSATAAVGVLTMAALRLTSQVYDIGMEQDGEVEP